MNERKTYRIYLKTFEGNLFTPEGNVNTRFMRKVAKGCSNVGSSLAWAEMDCGKSSKNLGRGVNDVVCVGDKTTLAISALAYDVRRRRCADEFDIMTGGRIHITERITTADGEELKMTGCKADGVNDACYKFLTNRPYTQLESDVNKYIPNSKVEVICDNTELGFIILGVYGFVIKIHWNTLATQ